MPTSPKQMLRRLLNRTTMEERRSEWPPAQHLSATHVSGAKVVVNRTEMLDEIPKGGVTAEIGVFKRGFSPVILERTEPQMLHLVDVDPEAIRIAGTVLASEISAGRVETHVVDSAEFLRSRPKNYFDWVYVDGDHSYEGAKRDLEAAESRLKPNGLIALNDYIFFDAISMSKFGVMEATNEFCIDYGFRIKCLALHGRGFYDLLLERL